jgi:DNA segregation ATPase FtsK/SpoIIIE-like protein
MITRKHELPVMLLWLQQEMDRRTDILRGHARDLDEYNKSQPADQQLPYIVVVIDEIANAMLAKEKIKVGDLSGTIASLTESLLADIAARARATGIHLVVSTQRPSVDVVTGLIKANFPARIAFGTASEVDSRVIIDDGSAAGLEKGRMKFRRNMELIDLQAPFLSDSDVVRHVAAAARGERLAGGPTQADLERAAIGALLAIAESEFAGHFPVKKLAKTTKISFEKLEAIGKRLEVEGILSRNLGPFPRSIAVQPSQWKKIYPPS